MLSTATVLGSTPIVHGDSVSVSHARELLPFLRQKKEVNRRKDKQVVNLGAYLGRVKSRDDRCTAVYIPVTKDLSKLGRLSIRVLRVRCVSHPGGEGTDFRTVIEGDVNGVV